MIYIYLIIAMSLLSSVVYHAFQWNQNHRRRDDLFAAGAYFLLSMSFAVYGYEGVLHGAKGIELVIDSILAVYLMVTVLYRFFWKKKRGV